MTSLTLFKQNGSSPFDLIRQFTPDGQEFWSARDLMKFMGYAKWQNFHRIITQSIEVLGNYEDNLSLIFQTEIKVRGRMIQDYRLTRYACYLIAMSCDDRKNPIVVAQAHHYFAIKTRQAELYLSQPVRHFTLVNVRLAIAHIDYVVSTIGAEEQAAVALENSKLSQVFQIESISETQEQKAQRMLDTIWDTVKREGSVSAKDIARQTNRDYLGQSMSEDVAKGILINLANQGRGRLDRTYGRLKLCLA
jgi:hypothetical protein